MKMLGKLRWSSRINAKDFEHVRITCQILSHDVEDLNGTYLFPDLFGILTHFRPNESFTYSERNGNNETHWKSNCWSTTDYSIFNQFSLILRNSRKGISPQFISLFSIAKAHFHFFFYDVFFLLLLTSFLLWSSCNNEAMFEFYWDPNQGQVSQK